MLQISSHHIIRFSDKILKRALQIQRAPGVVYKRKLGVEVSEVFCSDLNLQFSIWCTTWFLEYKFLCTLMYTLRSNWTKSCKRISPRKMHVGLQQLTMVWMGKKVNDLKDHEL